jgi:hypothetical protein
LWEKGALSEKIKCLDDLISQTREEKCMLIEDLVSHLEEQKEKASTIELITAHIEGLKSVEVKTIEEIEKEYYIKLVQALIEEHSDNNNKAEQQAFTLINNINTISIDKELEDIMNTLELKISKEQLTVHKTNYIKLYNETNKKLQAELNTSYNFLNKIEESMKTSKNFIENVLQPSIQAVKG